MAYPNAPACYGNAPQMPQAAPLYANNTQAAQARVKQAQENLSVAEAALANQQAYDAKIEAINADASLAGATVTLMTLIQSIVSGAPQSPSLPIIAKYRKELQPLAERHGYKIVLIGDKSSATVVAA